MAPDCDVNFVGIRPGEKLHEVLISEDESRLALDVGDMFVIQPAHPWWQADHWQGGKELPLDYRYASNTNDQWLNIDEIRALVDNLEIA
jgi:UDP-N-acetylglucosamine 4,6-dehydratase